MITRAYSTYVPRSPFLLHSARHTTQYICRHHQVHNRASRCASCAATVTTCGSLLPSISPICSRAYHMRRAMRPSLHRLRRSGVGIPTRTLKRLHAQSAGVLCLASHNCDTREWARAHTNTVRVCVRVLSLSCVALSLHVQCPLCFCMHNALMLCIFSRWKDTAAVGLAKD